MHVIDESPDLIDGKALLLYPMDRAAWSGFTRLLWLGKAQGSKQHCLLDWSDVAAHAEGLIAILLPDKPDARAAGDLRYASDSGRGGAERQDVRLSAAAVELPMEERDIDTDRIDDAVLALMFLTLHDLDRLSGTCRA